MLRMFQPLEEGGEGGAEGATGFTNPCFGWIFILMEIKFTGNSPELRGTHPKARHSSRVLVMGQGGVGVMDVSSQLDPGRLAFSSCLWDLWLGREGEGKWD